MRRNYWPSIAVIDNGRQKTEDRSAYRHCEDEGRSNLEIGSLKASNPPMTSPKRTLLRHGAQVSHLAPIEQPAIV